MSFVMREDWSEEGVGGRAIWSYYIYCGKCGALDISWLNEAKVEQEKLGFFGKRRQKVRTYGYKCEKCGFEFCHTFPKPQEDNPFGYTADSEDLSKARFFGVSDYPKDYKYCAYLYDIGSWMCRVMPVYVVVSDETKTSAGGDMRKVYTAVWDHRQAQYIQHPFTSASEIHDARQRYFAVAKRKNPCP